MAECINKRFEKLLHAYELDMLSDHDRREFELHLMECDYCLERLKKLQPAARLMRENAEVQSVSREVLDKLPHDGSDKRGKEAGTIPSRRLAAAIILSAVVLLILILKPWNIEISPDKEAIAAQNRLLIMPFTNLAESGDTRNLGRIASDLLMTDLAESEYIQVVSSQLTNDILKSEGKEKLELLDPGSAEDIARKARARFYLTGSILEVDPQYVISVQIVSLETGDLYISQRIAATPDEDIFKAVDKLSAAIKRGLNLPAAAYKEVDRNLADVTTDSYQAYFYYTEGKNFRYQHRWSDAVGSFKKAIEYDSTFAMAYYYLAALTFDQNYLAKAVEYSANITRRERLYIQAYQSNFSDEVDRSVEILKEIIRLYPDEIDACFRLGFHYDQDAEYRKGLEYFNRVLDINPSNKIVHNYISLDYNRLGNFEKAIEANNRYIEMAPREANPYDSRGLIFANYGHLDSAIAAYRKALEMNPDFVNALTMLGRMYIFKLDYRQADSCHKLALSRGDKYFRVDARLLETYISLFQGKLNQTLEIIDRNIETNVIEMQDDLDKTAHHYNYLLKAEIHTELQDFETARKDYERFKSLRPYDYDGPDDVSYSIYIDLLIRWNEIKKAEQVAESLLVRLEKYKAPIYHYNLARAQILLAQDRPQEAMEYLNQSDHLPFDVYAHYWKGQTYLRLKNFDSAIAQWEKALKCYTRLSVYSSIMYVKIHYWLARTYEATGDIQNAISHYKEFIDIWREADFDSKELQDARVRLLDLVNQGN